MCCSVRRIRAGASRPHSAEGSAHLPHPVVSVAVWHSHAGAAPADSAVAYSSHAGQQLSAPRLDPEPRGRRRRRATARSARRSSCGRAARGRDDWIVRGGPDDLEVVVFGIGEVARAALEELGVCGLLGDAPAGATHLLRQRIDLVSSVGQDADREAHAATRLLGLCAPVLGQPRHGKQAHNGLAQSVGDEVLVFEDHWPIESVVERTQARKLARAEGEDIGQWCRHTANATRMVEWLVACSATSSPASCPHSSSTRTPTAARSSTAPLMAGYVLVVPRGHLETLDAFEYGLQRRTAGLSSMAPPAERNLGPSIAWPGWLPESSASGRATEPPLASSSTVTTTSRRQCCRNCAVSEVSLAPTCSCARLRTIPRSL